MFTSSHSLSELKSAMQPGGRLSSMLPPHLARSPAAKQNPMVPCVGIHKIVLDVRRGFYFNTHFKVKKGHTSLKLTSTNPPNSLVDGHTIDDDTDGTCKEEFEFIQAQKLSTANDRKKIDKLVQALEFCVQASYIDYRDPRRYDFIQQAIQLSPDLCARAHYMKFELIISLETNIRPDADPVPAEVRERIITELENAIRAGQNLKKFIKADEMCVGNLYTFSPTRFYVRSLFALGSLYLLWSDYARADMYLKKYLAQDIHDKLGARHKQLQACLEKGMLGKGQMTTMLDARFTNDQCEDNVMALWNYTRALHRYKRKGNNPKSKGDLHHAIECNPHVPPLVLAWELPKEPEFLMVVGDEGEAADYAVTNTKFWLKVKGAMKWLEEAYREVQQTQKTHPYCDNEQCMTLFVRGTQKMGEIRCTPESKKQELARQAIDDFDEAWQLLSDIPASKMFLSKVLERRAACRRDVEEYDLAIQDINAALLLCNASDHVSVKELMYDRAAIKELKNELKGALEDYKWVYNHIGKFSTAFDQILKLEASLRVSPTVQAEPIPVHHDPAEAEVQNLLREFASQALVAAPMAKTTAAKIDRCANCERGGIDLLRCGSCHEIHFCSEECISEAWRTIHKYTCMGSKHRLKPGCVVRVKDLSTATHYNGRTAKVVQYLPEQKRFSVELDIMGEDDASVKKRTRLAAKGKNLVKVKIEK